jgi:hypothetical protein
MKFYVGVGIPYAAKMLLAVPVESVAYFLHRRSSKYQVTTLSLKVKLVRLVELHMLLSRMLIWSVPGERGFWTYVAADGYAIESMIAQRPGRLNWRASGVMIHVLL